MLVVMVATVAMVVMVVQLYRKAVATIALTNQGLVVVVLVLAHGVPMAGPVAVVVSLKKGRQVAEAMARLVQTMVA